MGLTYKDSGVDKEKGYEEVQIIKEIVKKTHGKEVLTGIGGFAGLFKPELTDMKEPVLVSGTDGVGTKIKLAMELDKHDTVGIDLVAMCVNDVLCQGAKPLFFLDYIATGSLKPAKMADLVRGVAEGCSQSECALIGGETAEMPGLYKENDYDLAGFAVGIVDRDKIIDGSGIKEGDVAISLSSSGVHSNGFSLVRAALDMANVKLSDKFEDTTVGERLLVPTRIYEKEISALLKEVEIKGIAHITGGGLYENVPRMLPENIGIEFDIKESEIDSVFKAIQKWGNVETKEMFSTFNMGIGMVVVVDAKDVDKSLEILQKIDPKAKQCGVCKKTETSVKINLK
ncbi:phosphoribosylformylglycinamidine cyclo-ligase [Finegoldia magna]|uniref:Phosphoribosylformylglycinamidine cyclo-ligase n=2 Tax=Finegoldia magna TaxID=1260 RepID=PUR5_FINM2|nr:phosphoribosylformylglycinamidine cyclo-ligase [Finegoldia magna]B0S0R2.1 RecName: Full=Phosphoribosylformylglycinamidine cyclo-ligase; AltName: Full=AIR synthase; AltName: Full=AIRS; AltName: Full=Phosphoribosyl-aminoimidazole synthetase [Finegoldia magna ATCC 29328]MDU5441763.1 phosphoribosylformylglycinamidine cyclo-ligase [Finegoldia magna]UEA70906.1 phosphoribosylformylglycinamidine cyclo-ligase [Finegoldia magna]BAG07729.1 phosphoribosylformylglycinamidine cyclo-ligase [Finegoldia magn